MYQSLKKHLAPVGLLAALCATLPVQAADLLPLAKSIKPNTNSLPPAFEKPLKATVCFFDIQGSSGEFYGRAKDIGLIARRWNIIADFKVFTDEVKATESFKAGQCDAAVISTMRARQFNKFMGSIDAIGGVPTYEHMRLVLKTMFDPRLEPFTISEPYQIVGAFPVGAQYLHVRDQSMNSIGAMAGKKVSVFDADVTQARMIEKLGGQPVPASLADFTRAFNKGDVDMLVAPAMAYAPYELHRGLGEHGGIIGTPITQVTASLVINRDLLKKKTTDLDSRIDAFHKITAEFLDQLLDRNLVTIQRMEKEIPDLYWMKLNAAQEQEFQDALRSARIQMTKEGLYDARMMKVLKKVRCKVTPAAAECSSNDE